MPADLRDLAGRACELEQTLARALALSRVLTFALRNRQAEPVNRTTINMVAALDASIEMLMQITRESRDVELVEPATEAIH